MYVLDGSIQNKIRNVFLWMFMPIRDLCVRTLCFLFLLFASVCETKCFSDAFNEGFGIFPRAKVSAFINSVVPLGSRAIVENGYAIFNVRHRWVGITSQKRETRWSFNCWLSAM
jgi:hypothetical protein